MIARALCTLLIAGLLPGCKSGGGCCHDEPAAAKAEDTMADAKSKRILGLDQGWELAPRAGYTASQSNGEVTIKARGEHPASNYEGKLVMSPLRIWPPQWILARHKTADVGGMVIVPYEVTEKFKAAEPVAKVRISDADGSQDVAVDQVK